MMSDENSKIFISLTSRSSHLIKSKTRFAFIHFVDFSTYFALPIMMFRLLFIGLIAISSQGTSAFSPTGRTLQRLPGRTIAVDVKLSAEQVNRRTIFANAAVTISAAFLAPSSSFALNTFPADNEIVKEQRTVVNKLDINNAPVADYMQFPGMYPTIGGKIANNGPYDSFRDVYKLKILSKADKQKIKEYESEFTATPSTGLDTMRVSQSHSSSSCDIMKYICFTHTFLRIDHHREEILTAEVSISRALFRWRRCE
jgi:hypothetical protein